MKETLMQRIALSFVLVCYLCTITLSASAQNLGPDLATLSNQAFGWTAMSGGNPAVDSMSEYASNMLGVPQAGYRVGMEVFVNRFDFGDLHVVTNQDTALATIGSGTVRVSYFRYDSNTASDVRFLQQVTQVLGAPTTGVMRGEALDLSYAQPVGSYGTIIGASFIPFDTSHITLTAAPYGAISRGKTVSLGGIRMGVLQPLMHGVRLGANYSYQGSSATSTFLDPTVPGMVTQNHRYLTRKLDLGVLWQALPRLQCFGAYSNTLTTGGTLNGFSGETETYGARYVFTPALTSQLTTTGTNHTAAVYWKTRYGMFSGAYAYRPLTSAESYLGEGQAIAGMLDLAF
jgi:hypothetical protein